MGDLRLSGVYRKAYNKIENTESTPATKFSVTKVYVPAIPINKLSTSACPVVMRPAGIGLSAVRFINLSRSRSIISLNPFAEPVTKKPPSVNIIQWAQLISQIGRAHV